MPSFKFKNVFIKDSYSVVGPYEKKGKIKKFDEFWLDFYGGNKTIEQAEIAMQNTVVLNLLSRNNLIKNNIDIVVGGDLSNQISTTNYNMSEFKIPTLGVYSACATFVESLIVAGTMIHSNLIQNSLVITSSHNLASEKQFRFPIEYGAPKPSRSTFTATGSVGAILQNERTPYELSAVTIGKVVDYGIKDAYHMGAVMAPAAIDTLIMHLNNLQEDISDYDLILTGDLGRVGEKIFRELLISKNLKAKKYLDAATMLYDYKTQEVYAGASGPIVLPLVLFNKILKEKKYHNILIIGTGSLHSPVMVNQKLSIPAIAHAAKIEVTR